MEDRKSHRTARRRFQGQKRIRRAVKCGTTTDFSDGHRLSSYEKPIFLTYTVTSFAWFLNSRRPKGLITPSVRQLVQAHASVFREIAKLVHVDVVAFEVSRFAFTQMEDGTFFREADLLSMSLFCTTARRFFKNAELAPYQRHHFGCFGRAKEDSSKAFLMKEASLQVFDQRDRIVSA